MLDLKLVHGITQLRLPSSVAGYSMFDLQVAVREAMSVQFNDCAAASSDYMVSESSLCTAIYDSDYEPFYERFFDEDYEPYGQCADDYVCDQVGTSLLTCEWWSDLC